MSFLVPGFIFLTALVGVPIAIHLLGRPRAKRKKFAAMAFLVRSDRQVATRNKVREWLLLAARILVLASVPLLLAKPFLEVSTSLPVGLGGVESAVIVVDDSRSLGWREAGKASLAERGLERARAIVDHLGRGSEAAILVTSRGSVAPQPELTGDRERLRAALGEIHPTRRPGDVTAALRRAAALLATSTHAARRVYLISDLAAHGFAAEAPWGPDAGGPSLVPVDVTDGSNGGNHAIVDVRTEPAPQLGARGLRLSAEIANFSDQPVKELPVTLHVDGKAVAKGLVDVPARGRTIKRFFHVFPARNEVPTDEERTIHSAPASEPLVHEGSVEIPADALPDDDRRFFRLAERRSIRVLIVDGDPRTVRREDEAFYLETALRPGERGDSPFEVTVVSGDDLSRRALDPSAGAAVDVVFLANVKAPDVARAAALRAFVERGGGLFLSLGRNVDPDAWNAALGDLLPQPIATLRTVGETLESRDGDGEARVGGPGERVGRFDRRHSVLEVFGDGAHSSGEALREARVGRFALLKPTPRAGADERQVLLRLEGGAPLLVEGRLGAGKVMLLTTTIDRDWSELAIQPAFLPLVQQATRHLAGATLRESDAPTLLGDRHAIPLGPGDVRVDVTLPSGRALHHGADRTAGRKTLDFVATDEPGLYRVAAGPGLGAGPLTPRPAAAFVINVDAVESDPLRIDPPRLAALSGKSATATHSTVPTRRVELWHALGAGLLALLVLEGLLALRRA